MFYLKCSARAYRMAYEAHQEGWSQEFVNRYLESARFYDMKASES